eukprot:6191712-Pleurochrysis_carterae.AAC.1
MMYKWGHPVATLPSDEGDNIRRHIPSKPVPQPPSAGDTGGRWVGERLTPTCALATPSCGVARETLSPPPHGGGCLSTRN